MEDDDEFGDLYTDVLRPLTASFQAPNQESVALPTGGNAAPPSQNRPIDINKNNDDKEILHGASDLKNSISNPSSGTGLNLNVPVKEPTLPESDIRHQRGEFDLNLDFNSEGIARGSQLEDGVLEKYEAVNQQKKASNFIEDDDDINIVVEERDTEDDDLLGKDNNFIIDNNSAPQEKNTFNLPKESEIDSEQMIPGLSEKLDNPRASNFEDEWDSEESEDDLQIVLNDNDHGPMGLERIPGMDDDEDPLVIVADNGDEGYHNQQMMMEEQQWGGEEGGPAADKEVGDAAKSSVAVGSTTQAALQPKIGYSGHAYHQPFHSQFKYVRPGAQPVPGAAPGGMSGQVRPPFPMGLSAGRGRGDWRPTGIIKGDNLPMQKGYGIPPWGANTAGRGYGSGLDFTLPSHKTIFEVDIDSFEEKPWKLPGIDVTEFFNFGLNEESWKDYRKQLEQLRLGTTMQNKIRVYEIGRADKDYDPDLPPELAAAVGNQDIPSENAILRNVDAGPTDSANVRGRPPLPIGKPIPVDISSGDRLPSIDTRRSRMHDTDAIIEVFCQSSKDDEDPTEQQDVDDLSGEVDIDGNDESDDDHISHAYKYNGRKREPIPKRGHSKHSSPDVPMQQQPDGEIGVPHDPRSAKGKRRVRSPKMIAKDDKRLEKSMHSQDEESFDSGNSKQSRHTVESDGEQAVIARDDTNDNKSTLDDRSSDMEGADVDVDDTTKDTLEDKQKLSSQENDESEDSKVARSPPRRGNVSIPVRDEDYAHRKGFHEREETGRKHVSAKGRDDSHSRGSGDPNLSFRQHMKGESDLKKESDLSEGNWHLRDDDRQGRWNRVKVRESEKTAKEEHYQSRNVMDKRSWRAVNHDSIQRERDQSVKSRSGKADDIHSKKRKEGPYVSREHAAKEDVSYSRRENSSRRKRERDDVSDQWKRDDRERERDEWHRIKPVPEENISRREREETRSMMKSGRGTEDKAWNSHSRRKDEYKGSSKEFQYPSDQLKRRDQIESESFSQHRGNEDVARYERPGSRNDRTSSHAYDASRVNEHKQKESRRKGKDSESVGRGSLVPSRRKHDEQGGQTSQTVSPRGKTERESGENDRRFPKKQKEEALSDEDRQPGSRKGRSKFERWTSNKERDFTTTTSIPSPSLRNKDLDTLPISNSTPLVNNGLHKEPSKKVEDTPQLLADDKDKDTGTERNVKAKVTEDKHLDTVEKLKKRSERFKLHVPSEKDTTMGIKKTESEALPSAQTETAPPVSDVKPERPARKRRWTGN